MRYRIKRIMYESGRCEFYAQKKVFFGWTGLFSDGEEGYDIGYEYRSTAIGAIDANFRGNASVYTIDFEYINK
jgi:hypothetical protein